MRDGRSRRPGRDSMEAHSRDTNSSMVPGTGVTDPREARTEAGGTGRAVLPSDTETTVTGIRTIGAAAGRDSQTDKTRKAAETDTGPGTRETALGTAPGRGRETTAPKAPIMAEAPAGTVRDTADRLTAQIRGADTEEGVPVKSFYWSLCVFSSFPLSFRSFWEPWRRCWACCWR